MEFSLLISYYSFYDFSTAHLIIPTAQIIISHLKRKDILELGFFSEAGAIATMQNYEFYIKNTIVYLWTTQFVDIFEFQILGHSKRNIYKYELY